MGCQRCSCYKQTSKGEPVLDVEPPAMLTLLLGCCKPKPLLYSREIRSLLCLSQLPSCRLTGHAVFSSAWLHYSDSLGLGAIVQEGELANM